MCTRIQVKFNLYFNIQYLIMFRYRPEIDGLRAIAIIPVIFFHAGFENFQGGFIGVDVFFVISGYLISSIIFRELSAGRFTLKNFYERRARRIIPALFLVLIVSFPMALLWMPPVDMLDFSQSLVAIPLFVANFLFYSESGYFDSIMEVKPLFHTWSLAVEEQFYVLFPLLIIFLWKYKANVIIGITLIIFIASLIAAELFSHSDRMLAFFMLPTRAWELLLGFGVAFIEFHNATPLNKLFFKNLLSLFGLTLIVYSVFYFNENTLIPGVYALIPTVGTALIIMFSQDTHVGRLIGNRYFVGIGLLSYSAYLWHQPLFAFVRIYRFGDTKFGMFASAILITFILAFLTWKFVEKPFRDKSILNLRTVTLSFVISGLFIVSIGLFGVLSNGFESLYKSRLTETERIFFNNAKEISELRNNKSVNNFPECFIKYSESDEFYQKFNNCFDKNGPAVVLMGDSHMGNVKRALSKTQKYNFIVSVSGHHCHPYHYYDENNISTCDFDNIHKFIKAQKLKISFLIYNQLGSYFLHDEKKDTLNHKSVDYAKKHIMEVDIKRINKILKYLNLINSNVKVIWLASWIEPRYPMHNPRKIVKYGIDNLDYIPNVVKMFSNIDQEIDNAIYDSGSEVAYIKLFDNRSKSNFLSLIENNCVTFNDKDHLSSCGEKIAGPIFHKKIQNSLNSVE